MPSPIDELVKRRVIEKWINGFPRDKIASDLQISAGTVSNIVSEFKNNLQGSDIDSIRELAAETRKQGFTLSDLAQHIRLRNFFIKSGASEEKVESFITNISSRDVPPERIIELVNQLHDISKSESIPLDQIPIYIERKLEEKKKLDEQIKEADKTLQGKNVNIQAINEHLALNEKLKEYGLSTQDIDKLLNLLSNAKEIGFDSRLIVRKLRNIKRLENKENKLKNSCDVLSKQADKYKGIIPLAQLIWDLHIGKNELISFKIAVNEAAELYGFPRSTAAVYVLNNLREYNKKGQLKKELSSLYLQKYAINEFCSRHSQVIMVLMNLRNNGITEEQIISMKNFLANNGYKISSYTSTK
jgi:uncharacterized protein (UPF0335 family)